MTDFTKEQLMAMVKSFKKSQPKKQIKKRKDKEHDTDIDEPSEVVGDGTPEKTHADTIPHSSNQLFGKNYPGVKVSLIFY